MQGNRLSVNKTQTNKKTKSCNLNNRAAPSSGIEMQNCTQLSVYAVYYLLT